MQKRSNTLAGIVLILILSSFSFGEWIAQDVGFPEEIQVFRISPVSNHTAWVIGGRSLDNPFFQGISRTTDGGESWEYSTITVPGMDLTQYITTHVFALSDSMAWVVMAYDAGVPHRGRIVKTVDAGATWVAQLSAYPDQPGIHNGPDFIHFFDENDGITVGDLEEMYITSDGGDNWTKVPASNYPPIMDMEDPYNGSYTFMGDSSIAFGTNAGRVFRSSDRGATWIASSIGMGVTHVWTTFQDEMVGLATAPLAGRQIAKTIDGGLTWTTLPHELPVNSILSYQNGTDSTYMYASSGMPAFMGSEPGTGFTSDFGNSWQCQTNDSHHPLAWAPRALGIFTPLPVGWAGSTDNLVHKFVPRPQFWVAQDPGYPEDMQVVNQYVVNEDVIWTIGGRIFDQPIYHGFSVSVDGGETWTFRELSNPDLDNFFLSNVFALSDQTAWITMVDNTSEPHRGRLYKTNDGGETFVHQSTAYVEGTGTGESANFVYFFDENDGITIGDYGHYFVTSNGGDLWTQVPDNLRPQPLVAEQALHSNYNVAGDSTMWFGTNKGRIARTTDRGASWTISEELFGPAPIFASFQNESVGLAVSPLTGTGRQVAKTTDGGTTWTMLDSDFLPYRSILNHVKGTENTYMYASADLPLYFNESPYGFGFIDEEGIHKDLIDGGGNYTLIEGCLALRPGSFDSPDLGWTGAMDNMIYKYKGPWLGDPPDSIGDYTFVAPAKSVLVQNFPNPFNPVTNIQYELGSTGYVALEIFNLRGAQVSTVVNQFQNAGHHSVTFDASGLASGTYIYRLSTVNGSISRKMLLIK